MAGQSEDFIGQVDAGTVYHPDGWMTVRTVPGVWTVAHRGYSGSGRLDVWVYPSEQAALRAAGKMAMEFGMDEDPQARKLFAEERFTELLALYEQHHREGFLLRVQSALLIHPDHDPADPWPGGISRRVPGSL